MTFGGSVSVTTRDVDRLDGPFQIETVERDDPRYWIATIESLDRSNETKLIRLSRSY